LRTRIRREKKTGYVIAEADTAARAMKALQSRLGPKPHIEEARRVRRGGFLGFFAKERFHFRALPEAPATVTGAEMVEPTELPVQAAAAVPDFGEALSAALFGGYEDEVDGAADSEPETVPAGVGVLVAGEPAPRPVGPLAGDPVLAASLGTASPNSGGDPWIPDSGGDEPAAVPAEAAAAAAGAPDWRIAGPAEPVPRGRGAVRWSTGALLERGIPKVIGEAAAGLDERDDLGWINAIAGVLAPHCTDLPDGPAVFAGTGAADVADALGLPTVEVGSGRLPTGSFATDVPDRPEALAWLASVLADRHLHLVIGENAAWLHLLVDDPAAVTFTADHSIVDALYVTLTLGAPLGFGLGGDGELVRMAPIEAALAVRRVVGRR
jgi:hypothetical protein